MKSYEAEVVFFLVHRFKETYSPNFVESDLHAIKCFWLLKIMVAKDFNCLSFEPQTVQCIIKNAIVESGPDNFVGLHQAALYVIMF